ncbi:MAG: SCO family protein [Micavibrio sp.]
MKKPYIPFLIVLAAGLILLAALFTGGASMNRQGGAGGPEGYMAVTDDAFGGPFTLTNHKGERVTDRDLRGRFRLIYFGFTFCPAICPTELAKITAAINALGEAGEDILPVFITVDPERDDVKAMASYVTLFHPAFVGLTGTPEEIAATTKAYKIYAAKVQDDSMTDYTVDHSSFIYFMAPDDRLLHIFKMDDSAADMTKAMRAWMAYEQQPQ